MSAGESEEVSFTYKATDNHNAPSAVRAVKVKVKAAPAAPEVNLTAFRPTVRNDQDPMAGPLFPLTPVPENVEHTAGAGVRSNGDDDNGNEKWDWYESNIEREDDLIQISMDFGATQAPAGITYFLKRDNANVNIWTTATKGAIVPMIDDVHEVEFNAAGKSFWVEWVNSTMHNADTHLTFEARQGETVISSDVVRVFRFTSIVIVFGGLSQSPSDYGYKQGVFVLGQQFYEEGYDAGQSHLFSKVSAEDVEEVCIVPAAHFAFAGDAYFVLHVLFEQR